MEKYILGADIGGTTCKMGLFDENGTLIEKWEISTDRSDTGKNIVRNLAEDLHQKMAEKSIQAEQILGIGVGIPAMVAPSGKVVISANIGWKDYWVEKELSYQMEGILVRALKDSNAAVLGEMWKGAAIGCKNVSLITLGTGVGGGNVIDGKIVIGARGAGGDIGHIQVNPNESSRCGCGLYGCLEQYASATGIVRMAKRALEGESVKSLLSTSNALTSKEIFAAYEKGDKVAQEVVDGAAQALALGLSMVACTIDPEIFLVGGGVAKAGQVLIDLVKKHYQQLALGDCKETPIKLAGLGNDAGIYGCAWLILDGV